MSKEIEADIERRAKAYANEKFRDLYKSQDKIFCFVDYQKGATDQQSTFEAQLEAARREGFKDGRLMLQSLEVPFGYDWLYKTEDDYIADYKKQRGDK